ncbi:MAG: hypothetical protein RLZZ171_2237, partial [Cyanobacteriota bacterium]
IEQLIAIINQTYPNGVPAQLQQNQDRFARVVGDRL